MQIVFSVVLIPFLQVVAVVLESVILGLMIGMYNSLDANFNLGWPWIMAIVALSFLVLGKILFIVLVSIQYDSWKTFQQGWMGYYYL